MDAVWLGTYDGIALRYAASVVEEGIRKASVGSRETALGSSLQRCQLPELDLCEGAVQQPACNWIRRLRLFMYNDD